MMLSALWLFFLRHKEEHPTWFSDGVCNGTLGILELTMSQRLDTPLGAGYWVIL